MVRSYIQNKEWSTGPDAFPSAREKAAFVEDLRTAPESHLQEKVASGLNDVVKRILIENSFTGHILEPKPITAAQMLRPVNEASGPGGVQEIGFIMVEIEPNAPRGRSVPFTNGPNQQTFRGTQGRISIGRDETPELYKHVDELATYQYDVRALIVDNMLRHLDNRPDYRLIATIDAITGSDPNANGSGGYRQYQEVLGQIRRETYRAVLAPFVNAQLTHGISLISRATALDFLAWDRLEIGGDKAQDIMEEGLQAIDKLKLFGIPHISSIKTDLIPQGFVYSFLPQNWLGRYFIYEDTKVFVRREKDMIFTSASRKYGLGILNEAGVNVTKFLNTGV